MTLFKGLRVKPTPSEDNPRGYTDGYDVIHQGRTYNIGPDDISKYNWDTRRLYPLLDAAFDRSAWHLSQLGFRNHDAILIFDDMEKRFEGRDAKDVLYHTMNLHRFLPLPTSRSRHRCTSFRHLQAILLHVPLTTRSSSYGRISDSDTRLHEV